MVVLARVIGAAISVPPLVGVAVGLSGRPVPTVPGGTLLAIVAGAVVLGVAAIAVPTRSAVRAAHTPGPVPVSPSESEKV